MKSIPLTLLKSLLAVAESKNLSEAAAQLKITQPGLTKQMQTLDELLPHKLFVIDGRKKKLTQFGNELVEQLKHKMSGIDSVVQQTCERFTSAEDSRVRIIGRTGVLDRISAKLKFPGKLVLIDTPSKETLQRLVDQKAELGITYLEGNQFDLIAKPLYLEKFKFVIPRKLLAESSLHLKTILEDLKALPCVTFKDPDDLIIEIFENTGVPYTAFNVRRTTANFDSILAMTNADRGWSLVPRHFSINKNKCWSIDVPSKLHSQRKFYLYYKKELSSAPWLKQLRNEIESCFAE